MLQGCSLARVLAAVAATFVLSGCPGAGPRQAPPPSIERAEALLRQGSAVEAARIFEAAAAQRAGDERNALLLRATRAWLSAGRANDAARTLDALSAPIAEREAFEQRLLRAELALLRGDAATAWREIEALDEPSDPTAAAHYFGTRERVALAVGRPIEAVRSQIALERTLETAEAREASRTELLAGLRDASERGVRIEPLSTQDRLVRGWLELGLLSAKVAKAPSASAPEVEAWIARYPNHPAVLTVRRELLGQSPDLAVSAVAHVAVLLPLSGRQASAAATVRDGFMTAWFQAPIATRPRVRVYDTGSSGVADVVSRAAQDGADFIVGPLTREEVIAAADYQAARLPTLALNFLPPDHVPPPTLFQFALSPEDEARAVARRVLADGHRRGVALAPEGDWGTRVLAAFRSELEAGGGHLLGEGLLESGRTDFSPSITQVMRITDSRGRHRRLESLLGTKLAFEPRRREDIEFVFSPSTAPTARLLRPQLRFHYAGHIPAYATSEAFEPDTNANRDLDGLSFPDMPWMLGTSDLSQNVRDAARDAWPTGGPRRNRLFAFGYDAYRLLEALRAAPDGAARPLDVTGMTGRLTLDADRRVLRELDWAVIRDGQPQTAGSLAP